MLGAGDLRPDQAGETSNAELSAKAGKKPLSVALTGTGVAQAWSPSDDGPAIRPAG